MVNPTLKLDEDGYDGMYRDAEARFRPVNKYLQIEVWKNAKILDSGCGCGYLADYVQRLNPTNKVFGIDNYPSDICYARRRNLNIVYINCDVAETPYRNACFDLIISNQVFEHVKNVKQYLAEMYRILKPEGTIYFATPNKLFPYEFHYEIPFINYLPSIFFSKFEKLYSRWKTIKYINQQGFYVHTDLLKAWITNPKEVYFGKSNLRQNGIKFIHLLHTICHKLGTWWIMPFLPQYYILRKIDDGIKK